MEVEKEKVVEVKKVIVDDGHDENYLEKVMAVLNKCNIHFTDFKQLDGMLISRDVLLSGETYDKLTQEDIDEMKKLYSSGSLTSLQKNAKESQKWPLLNLVRQLLKSNKFTMEPIRKSNGYDKTGKKLYKRYFKITKM